MARERCQTCGQIIQNCICAFVCKQSHQTTLHILQHPSEQNASKGTLPFLMQCSNNCLTYVGESEQDFSSLQQQLAVAGEGVALLYPSQDAIILSAPSHHLAHSSHLPPIRHLILIDATWKKAYKIYQLNPWLHHLNHVALEGGNGAYQIRKAKSEHMLSTFEAASYALASLESFDHTKWIKAFDALMQHRILQLPIEARKNLFKSK